MDNKFHAGRILILLTILFLSCLFAGCNDSGSDSDKSKSVDTEKTWYRDADNDGYGDPAMSLIQAAQPTGYVDNSGDCADYDVLIFPGAPELCDGKDNNCNGTVDENACDPDLQTISGQITNLVEAQAYISGDSYLQLVFYPADGQLAFSNDAQGRRIYTSDLAIVDIPDDGAFSFETTGLVSGDYVVAAQALAPYDPGGGVVPILADDDGRPAIFSVSADDDSPLEIDLGNVRLPVPAVIIDEQTGPASPSGVSASDGGFEDRIRVTWNPSSEATTYEVYRAGSFAGQKTKVATTASIVYDDTSSLPCDVDFYYWVKAVNANGASDLFYSDLGFIRCPVAPDPQPVIMDVEEDVDIESEVPPEDTAAKPVILDAPTGTIASDGAYPDKISISWTAVPAATFYDVYRCEGCCGLKIKIGSSYNTSHEDFDVSIGDYYYWIKANNDSGTSEFSLPDTGYIMVHPFAPTGVEASDGTYYLNVK